MPYVAERVVHDADSHIMETADYLAQYAAVRVVEHLRQAAPRNFLTSDAERVRTPLAKQNDPQYRARDEAEIMLRKNWDATGALRKEDRGKALDYLGFASQLVFNTYCNGYMASLERNATDMDLIYGLADAHNRAMRDFCSADRRLLPTAYVPLADFARARQTAERAVADDFAALLVPSACPRTHSPSHVDLFPVWRIAEEAGIPVLFHVGGGGQLLDPNYFQNGLPIPPDFHGGAENFRSVDYMAIPYPVMQTLATLIIDGILEQHPKLMFGVIEQGASWLPGWMRFLDSAADAFRRNEERLQKLSLKPSEYVRRQIRATPYPAEDVGWIAREAGTETLLFSSDYPHVEGGRNPIKRFETSLATSDERTKTCFYRDNFVELMGTALTRRGLA
ncbi:MAG: amidohydrolase family protein [Sulfurifustaceae bacterium]